MVHALKETWRVLVPEGHLLDSRQYAGYSRVEIVIGEQVLLAGGVASNQLLRRRLIENSPVSVLVPEPILCTDNAAMIAACGYFRFQIGRINGLDLDVVPSLKLA